MRRSTLPGVLPGVLFVLVVSMLATACAGSEVPESARAQPVTIAPTPDPGDSLDPGQTPDPNQTAPSTTSAPLPSGTPTVEATTATIAPSPGGSWAAGRSVGDCFDSTEVADATAAAGPTKDCGLQHEYEIFFIGDSNEPAGARFPTSPEYSQRLFDEFCEPAANDFGGATIEQLPFETAIWTPPEVDWNVGDRRYACVAAAGLRTENRFKVGTAAAGNLRTDEGLVARATVNGQRDFYFSFQHSPLHPLTRGTYELPNTTPDVLPVGFLFASPLQDVDVVGNSAYDYNFESGDITRLETGLDGWEIASPQFVFDPPAFLFAARTSAEDDWDLYSAQSAEDLVQLTSGDGDQKWPTLTPDQSQVVYHSDGDIWIMDVDGINQRQLTADPGGDFEAAVSPDGSRIVFASDRAGSDDIWIMNIDGSDQQKLTDHPADEAWPFFSADGSLVYFQTDRLGVSSAIMVMEADGSNPSYFSTEFMTNAALLPADITERFAAELPTIADVLARVVEGVVPGADGGQAEIEHTSGRLSATLPAGWEFEERESADAAVLVAAQSIALFDTTWAIDGAMITLIEGTGEEFEVRRRASTAAGDASCAPQGETSEQDGDRLITTAEYTCGESGWAIIVGIYQADAGVGVLFEGQYDGEPSTEEDRTIVTAIGESLIWG